MEKLQNGDAQRQKLIKFEFLKIGHFLKSIKKKRKENYHFFKKWLQIVSVDHLHIKIEVQLNQTIQNHCVCAWIWTCRYNTYIQAMLYRKVLPRLLNDRSTTARAQWVKFQLICGKNQLEGR